MEIKPDVRTSDNRQLYAFDLATETLIPITDKVVFFVVNNGPYDTEDIIEEVTENHAATHIEVLPDTFEEVTVSGGSCSDFIAYVNSHFTMP